MKAIVVLKNKYTEAIDKLSDIRSKHRDLGATDTEPRVIAVEEIEGYIEGKAYKRLKIRDWELYSSMKCGEAVKEMNAQLKVIHKIVQGISAYDVSELVRWYGYEIDLY